ncbi:early nodulin-like protein 1 [Phtheirospermum japonicum]|uniref:Early nodulin-like protein 1 n=1 Tax=Phtheirospermum japonicum TaxID=374723 RepID=A0A830B2T3_9LAMI|nr:early nodulin-like protein 1 [Phtheirospermum japonicum]
MGRSYVSLVLFVLFSGFIFCSHGLQFIVGGKDGWGLNPSENYNRWAERLRFQVNDTLLFNYKKGSDSVVVVSKDDYNHCNTSNPNAKLEDGKSVYKFNRSGPFFFISGNKSSCDHGQKLIVVVLAVRNKPPAAPPSPAPAPAGSPADAPAPESGYVPSGNSTPAAHPPRRSFAAAAWSPSVMLVSTVSVVMSVCLGGFLY